MASGTRIFGSRGGGFSLASFFPRASESRGIYQDYRARARAPRQTANSFNVWGED